MRIIKCDILFVRLSAVLLLPLLLASFWATSAHASSIYDDVVHPVTQLEVSNFTSGTTTHDITTSYASAMSTGCPSGYSSFQSAVSDENGHWAIVQFDTPSDYLAGHPKKRVFVYWVVDSSASTTFSTLGTDTYTLSGTLSNLAVIWLNEDNNIVCDFLGGSQQPFIAYREADNPSNITFQPLLSTYPVVYPDGYAGTLLPDTYTPPAAKSVVRPDFAYQVNDKKFTAHDYAQNLPHVTPTDGYTIQGYSLEWTLYRCASDWDTETKSCSGSTIVDHQIKPQDQDYEFSVTDYDDYYINAQYLVQECYRYPSYPSTPDHCVYVDLGTELPDYDFDSTTVYLPITGSSYTGDTTQYQCDGSGYCALPVVDCSTKPDFIQKLSCQVDRQLKFGILNPSINAFKSLFTAFTVPANPTCSIPITNVAIMSGQMFPLSEYSSQACTRAAEFRAAFPIAPVLLNALFALFTITMLVRTFNRLTDHRDNDLIQGI